MLCEEVTPSSVTIFDASSGIPAQLSLEFFTLWSGKALLVSENPIELDEGDQSLSLITLDWIGRNTNLVMWLTATTEYRIAVTGIVREVSDTFWFLPEAIILAAF